jgi:predicted cation transporter
MLTHKKISMFKSGLRILAYLTIVLLSLSSVIQLVFGALLLAEVLGVVEEFLPYPRVELVDIVKRDGDGN